MLFQSRPACVCVPLVFPKNKVLFSNELLSIALAIKWDCIPSVADFFLYLMALG